jgi:hypothetical protein
MQANRIVVAVLLSLGVAAWAGEPRPAGIGRAGSEVEYRSHPPIRPLPARGARPQDNGRALFVDAARGHDDHDGSEARPWQSLGRAAKHLQPGDTLYLGGGTYYERVVLTASGSVDRPITIRSVPGELAVLDGGLREFSEDPSTAWEPCPTGVAGEFWSTRGYPELIGRAGEVNVLGHFADSMVPLHGYRFLADLRSRNVYWNLKEKVGEDAVGIYCGPGVFGDSRTGRIHIRLAHTEMPYLPPEDNYRGETDPRKLRLVVAAAAGPTLALRGVQHVRIQDVVVRGSRAAAIEVAEASHVEFDGVTAYGGTTAFLVRDTVGLGMRHTACRGIAAPWTFRGSLKYRAVEARLFSASGWEPTGAESRHFELAYCEFTDSVDGIFIGNVRGVRFHHNLVDNISDDGLFLTAATAYDGTTPGGDVHIYQNRLARCLTTLAFGVGHGRQRAAPGGGRQTGSGVFVYRNVFDYRRPVMYHQPASAAEPAEIGSWGRFASDHGGPTWEPLYVYHNSFLTRDPPAYAYGTAGLADHIGPGTRRRVFNNVVVNVAHPPGTFLPPPATDLQLDGNLLWSPTAGARADGLAKFLRSKDYEASKSRYAAGWATHDRFADPRLAHLTTNWKEVVDLRPQPDSPAIDSGMTLPAEWPDPLRGGDAGAPDRGVLPRGVEPWHVGVYGRLNLFGAESPAAGLPPLPAPAEDAPLPPQWAGLPAAIVEGYPEWDAPVIRFALRKHGVPVDDRGRSWLNPREYGRYRLVVLAGDLQRAAIQPDRYSADDLAAARRFLEQGGALWLRGRAKRLFDWTAEGRQFLQKLTGPAPPAGDGSMVLLTDHPWLRHLRPGDPHPWLAVRPDRDMAPLRPSQGESIAGARHGPTLLYRVAVGHGQLIYMGWQIHDSLPGGREPSIAAEQIFDEQYQIVANIVADLFPRRPE